MKLQIFCLYDMVVKSFDRPFYQSNKGAAIRVVQDTCREGGNMIAQHPDDYSLYLVGEFDSETGTVSALAPSNIGVVSSLLPKSE